MTSAMLSMTSAMLSMTSRVLSMTSGDVIDDIRRVIDDIARVIDDIARVIDDIARVIDDIARVIDDIRRVIDDIARVIDDIRRVIDDIARVIDDIRGVIDEIRRDGASPLSGRVRRRKRRFRPGHPRESRDLQRWDRERRFESADRAMETADCPDNSTRGRGVRCDPEQGGRFVRFRMASATASHCSADKPHATRYVRRSVSETESA